MHPIIIVLVLVLLCAFMMLLERRGLRTTLTMSFKADVKRETRFLAQYGQLICTLVTSVFILQLDPHRGVRILMALWAAFGAASLFGFLTKRLVGRARPRSEHAGQFLGPSLKHANYRESFPSSHSACAVAFACVLASAYPPAAVTFWTLALICAVLRYLMDAHWPSDVFGGIALGYVCGAIAWHIFF